MDPQAAQKQDTQGSLHEPNLFQLSGHGVHITYSTTSFEGIPHFEYHDAQTQTSYRGDNIRATQTELGTLVTVQVRGTVDTGSTSLTLLLPRVSLDAGNRAAIHTYAIRTVHRFSVVPAFNIGQRDLYETIALSGTASAVLF